MTVTEIVWDYLKSHGYDGLCGDECGCGLDDLMPCDRHTDCVPGYIHRNCKCGTCEGDDHFHTYKPGEAKKP